VEGVDGVALGRRPGDEREWVWHEEEGELAGGGRQWREESGEKGQ